MKSHMSQRFVMLEEEMKNEFNTVNYGSNTDTTTMEELAASRQNKIAATAKVLNSKMSEIDKKKNKWLHGEKSI